MDDSVPDGDSTKREGIGDLDQCQKACASETECKAFAFSKNEKTCNIYTQVLPGSRYFATSGLGIVAKVGYISAFKRSSFPPHPDRQLFLNTAETKSEAAPVSVCELVGNSSRYQGKEVRVHSRIYPAGIDTPVALVDSTCGKSIRLDVQRVGPVQKEQGYRDLDRYLSEYRTIQATMSGRFEMILVVSEQPVFRFELSHVAEVIPESRLFPPGRKPK